MIHKALHVESEVGFVCLPAKSTHLMESLDVVFFKPLKSIWKEILDNYRKESRRNRAISQKHFSVLLSELWPKLHPNIETNLRSGTTKFYPRNPHEPLK